MELDFALLAEKAETGKRGLLQLFGGGLNQVNAPEFPALAQLAIVAKFVGAPDEAGSAHVLSIAVSNPRGERLEIPQTKEIELGVISDDHYNPPGAMIIFEIVIAFSSPGNYALHLVADGQDAKELRLVVQRGGAPAVTSGSE